MNRAARGNAKIDFLFEDRVQQAGSGLEKIVAQSLRQSPAQDAPLLAWPVVCGSAVADRTRALSFEDGVLRVEVADAGWKSELQSLAARYVANINKYTPVTVQKIEFVVARTSAIQSMKVTDKDVAYVADLANLELTPEERAGMLRDLNSILEYVDRLRELDTSDVPADGAGF